MTANSLNYSVVLLDVGETLVGPAVSFGDIYARVLDELGHSLDAGLLQSCIIETADEITAEVPLGVDRYSRFPGGEAEYWLNFSSRVLRKATGSPVGERVAAGAVERLRDAFREPSAWHVFDDVRPALDTLKALGVRLGVVSNWDSRLPQVLEMLELAAYFDEVGVSHIEGIEKPGAELFHRVLERMEAKGSAALHVGDVPELDLDGARAAGIDGLLIDRRGRLRGTGHVAVKNLSRLPEFASNGLPAEFGA